ncbi:alpha-defensin 9-like [Microtus pennsylvanicus]|uniref:alpha-defensin 9-like n=1 Tax=Microtus pennsylvanicus TaxID=10058 RepID=UPI003F6ABC18
MKTLVLFSALMLLAFQAQANPLPEPNEEAKNKEQPGVEDQDVSISFGSPEGSALQDAAFKTDFSCSCKKSCNFYENVAGFCSKGLIRYLFCCK